MISRTIHIKNWTIHFYFAIKEYWTKEILSILEELGASKYVIKRVKTKIRVNKLNTGFTYSKPNKKESIVVIGRASDGGQFLNSCAHELRHLVDDIAKEYKMEMSGEPVAYLTGDIINMISDIVCNFSCDCCRYERTDK